MYSDSHEEYAAIVYLPDEYQILLETNFTDDKKKWVVYLQVYFMVGQTMDIHTESAPHILSFNIFRARFLC